jgi:hypothetical protein
VSRSHRRWTAGDEFEGGWCGTMKPKESGRLRNWTKCDVLAFRVRK